MKSAALGAAVLAGALHAAAIPALGADAAEVKVYDATQLTHGRYTVLKRIWTQTWRSAFWVGTYGEQADAVAALTSRAADEGADGVINLHCLNDTSWGGGYFCYGLAIKLIAAQR